MPLYMRVLFVCALSLPLVLSAQLRPGYDPAENLELLKVFKGFVDTPMKGMDVPASTRFSRVYRSPVMGLDNMWELHADKQGTAVISLRGTTANAVSWLENGYAAMAPASGEVQLDKDFRFSYHLADDPRAAVHVGWLVGMGFLQRDILPKVDSLYRAGTRDFLITGHSQGGALCYLLTAHLWQLQREGLIPADIRLKTYANAAPKPGNLFFAHHYEHSTRGWAFNTVNALDWVPEVPMSIQTVNDFNTVNPFSDAKTGMKKLPLKQRVAAKHVYNKLDKPTRKAQRNYSKYLGRSASGFVQKNLPYYVPPTYAETYLYARTGTIITLFPDSAYLLRFPQSKETLFVNHMLEPYVYLMERYTPDARSTAPSVPLTTDPKQAFRERKIRDGIAFSGTGHEPEWMVDINFEGAMGFRTLEDAQVWFTPPAESTQAADANVLSFHNRTEQGELSVTILEQSCLASMSGEEFPYAVQVRATDGKVLREFSGCGNFLPPQRLHDVWMLVSLNGDRIDPASMAQAPRLEFNTSTMSVSGTGGCNTIGGGFMAVNKGLRFGKLFSTAMACPEPSNSVERKFMEVLDSGTLRSTFKGNDLILTSPGGAELLFRRVE
jgi:heat shock protein HslJ/uncharacterized membrane protein